MQVLYGLFHANSVCPYFKTMLQKNILNLDNSSLQNKPMFEIESM